MKIFETDLEKSDKLTNDFLLGNLPVRRSAILDLSKLQITPFKIESRKETKPIINKNGLQLVHIEIEEEYRKKWNIGSLNDFCTLTKNGDLLYSTFFRIGGLGSENDLNKSYFMLLKYNEAYYSNDIMRMSERNGYKNKSNKYLNGVWCIFDNEGVIKFEAKDFENPYITNNSCIYSLGDNYYNIETNKLYCSSFTTCQSDKFLFLENRYDKDTTRQGVMKINKEDGTFKIL
jgi:hypothetical protein